MARRRRVLAKFPYVVTVLALACVFVSCGGGGGSTTPPPPPPAIAVAVSPSTANIAVRSTASFSATVSNSTNTGVTWSVKEGSASGTISELGLYTAPATVGTYHVMATSKADTSKSAEATVTVFVPAPEFKTTAPTHANEGSLYTYDIVATDPLGGSVSLALTSGPAGASLAGDTLTWTPSAEQSRKANDFVVTATTSAGGAATQAWSVVPTGSVHGKMLYRYLTASGLELIPIDFTIAWCSIYARAENGQFTRYDSTGKPDGTFTIAGVPAGFYWFVLHSWSSGWSWDPLWTDSRTLDLSYPFVGRSDRKRATGGQRQFNVTGLNPWQSQDWLTWNVPNTYEATTWGEFDTGAVNFNALRAPEYLADASKGDRAYLNQLVSGTVGGYPYRALQKSMPALQLTDTNESPAPVVGVMQEVPRDRTVRVNIALSQFGKLITNVNPRAKQSGARFFVNVHPFGLEEGELTGDYRTTVAEVDAYDSNAPGPAPLIDMDLGEISYGNPYPVSWPEVVEYEQPVAMDYNLPGIAHGTGIVGIVRQITDRLPTANEPLKPILNSISNVKIDGKDFTADTTISATPTLSWDIPSTGAPNGYLISVFEVTSESDNTRLAWWQTFRTAANSVWFPDGTFSRGHKYLFLLQAVYEGGRDFGSSPFLKGFPRASATYFSGIVTIGDSGSLANSESLPRGAEEKRFQLDRLVLRSR